MKLSIIPRQSATDTVDCLLFARECANDLDNAMLSLVESCPAHAHWRDLADDAARIRKYLQIAIDHAAAIMQQDIMAVPGRRVIADEDAD